MILLLLVPCAILLTFRDYGITWDEPMQNRYGSLVDRFYIGVLHGHYDLKAINEDLDFRYYGGLFDSIASGVEHLSPYGEFETRHLLNALVGLIAIVGCWKLARLLGGSAAAFWAVALLVLIPRFYGHIFNNPKDVPFAAGFVWSLYYLAAAIPLLPRIPWRLCFQIGCAIGLTLGVRVGGLLLLAYLAVLQCGYLGYAFFRSGRERELWSHASTTASRFLAITAVAWIIMLSLWPWAQPAPLTRPFQALAHFSAMPWEGTVLFHGAQVKAANLPRIYTVTWLAITLPESILALLLLAAAVGASAVWKKRLSLFRTPLAIQETFLAFAVSFPLMYVFITKPVLYDAERHSLYLVPPITCLCSIVLASVLNQLAGARRSAALAVVAILAICLAWQASIMIRLHPQEYVYFNQTVGGLPGAAGLYETDYWGNAYREAVKILVQYVGPERAKDASRNYKVYMTSTQRVSATYYFPPYLSLTADSDNADFFVATTRYNVDRSIDGCIVGTVERFGVPLAVIKDRRCLKPASVDRAVADHAGKGPKAL
ncbi:MAG TPA: hypothetical protein VKX49_17975 [Bryobacteraceae bacterium]|nr:hypothetical protein [Bryobacteraceae bacterium]